MYFIFFRVRECMRSWALPRFLTAVSTRPSERRGGQKLGAGEEEEGQRAVTCSWIKGSCIECIPVHIGTFGAYRGWKVFSM